MHRGTERNFQKACNRTKHSFTTAKSLWIAILEVKLYPLWSHFGRFLKLLKALRGPVLSEQSWKRGPPPRLEVWLMMARLCKGSAGPGHRG